MADHSPIAIAVTALQRAYTRSVNNKELLIIVYVTTLYVDICDQQNEQIFLITSCIIFSY
jgi:hypothetical protein